MDKDFHYYGTLYAALLAGFSQKESELIAEANQAVDEFNGSLAKKYSTELPTVATNYETILNFFNKEATAKIWSIFHFLPCLDYHLYSNDVTSKTFEDNNNKIRYAMLCHPKGKIKNKIINTILSMDTNNANRQYKLIYLGMSLHVLNDTWAHMDFAGYNSTLNDVGIDMKENGKLLNPLEWDMPPCKYINIGHARMGHWPDKSYAKYEYLPNWKTRTDASGNRQYHLHDNPMLYKEAFIEMYHILRLVKINAKDYNKEFDNTDISIIFDKSILPIITLANLSVNDYCKKWLITINAFIEFNKKSNEAHKNDTIFSLLNTGIFDKWTSDKIECFIDSKNKHYELVSSTCKEYIDNIPREHSVEH